MADFLFVVLVFTSLSLLLVNNHRKILIFYKFFPQKVVIHRKKFRVLNSFVIFCRQMKVKAFGIYVFLVFCTFSVHANFLQQDEPIPKNYNPCCSMPCQHRGVCTAISNSYYECDCPKGYYGLTCEKSTVTRWLMDKLSLDKTKKQKLIATGKLIWGLINNIPPLHNAALRHLFLSGSDLGGHDSQLWHNYHPYTTLDIYYNQSYFTRGLPPVPRECPTPLGIKGPRILPPVNEVFSLLLQRREFKPCPLGSNLMFLTFAQHLAYQFFKTSPSEREDREVDVSDGVTRRALRAWVGGKLKTRIINGEEYPPYLEDTSGVVMHYPLKSESGKEVFPKWAMEHKMLSETPLMFAMATIWLREHNRICDIISKEHPEWNDERIYQTARCIILGELLTITTEEFLQHLGQCRLRLEYKPELFHHEAIPTSNQMQFEFELAFQWNHMLPDVLAVQGTRYNTTSLMFSNNRIVFEHGLDAVVDSMSRHPAGQVTYRNCGKAFENVIKQAIESARKTRLHSLNDYRRFYGLKPYESFKELVDNEEMAETLEKLYGDVDAVEFIVGIFMEKHLKSVVPPTAVHLAGPVALRGILNNPIGSPALWRPMTFGGKTGFDMVQKASLRKLFCSNLRGNCRNNVWVSFRTPADVTASSREINSVTKSKK